MSTPAASVVRARSALSLVELIVVVAIIGVLAALMMTSVTGVRESAKSGKCRSNLRQLGLAMQGYVDENRGRLPCVKWQISGAQQVSWMQLIAPFADGEEDSNHNNSMDWGELRQRSVFRGCPNEKWQSWQPGYGMSVFLDNSGKCNSPLADGTPFYGSAGVKHFVLGSITYPATRILVGEIEAEVRLWGGQSMRHRAGRYANSLMCDMHLRQLTAAQTTLAFSTPDKLTD